MYQAYCISYLPLLFRKHIPVLVTITIVPGREPIAVGKPAIIKIPIQYPVSLKIYEMQAKYLPALTMVVTIIIIVSVIEPT